MKAVLQRVKSASVTVDGTLVSTIGKGILVFAGLGKDDDIKDAESMAKKVLGMRIFDSEEGEKWKRNVVDVGGEILCVSQFTLLASTKKNKPAFHNAAPPGPAKELYQKFFTQVQELYEKDKVKDGIFQAMMDVALVNDGPVGVDYRSEDGAVTIEIDTNPPKAEKPSSQTEKTYSLEDLAGNLQKIQTEFKIPAELLE